ncbi:hypothetical protein RJT34_09769 [Clitoria ternatea]|uniref:Uncharacterized protein n=1 Tax=Clitoria ternatea TaxID=43366 RepID=A0AAN9K7P0_CLITE
MLFCVCVDRDWGDFELLAESEEQPGTFDLVGTIVYGIDQHPYRKTFHNGTIEVVKTGAFLCVEFAFFITLGVALLVLLILWVRGQIQ